MTELRVPLGYEVGTGEPVSVPIVHLAVTGQTQQSGKTTTLEALASRAGGTVLTFITKRGEGSFATARRVKPYFRDRADWQFVVSIIDATLQEKNKFLRPWIMKICRTTKSLAEVQVRVREALHTAKGINEGVYTQLDSYLDLIVPEIQRADLAETLDLRAGINVMDVSSFATPMQMLFVQSALDWVNDRCTKTTVVIPEAWEFVPEGKGSPVKASAIALVRKGAGIGNHIWVDSQDMAGVDKTILRGCTVWLIGVQREANEVKRNIANIPASIKRPAPADVMNLERGQFFACFGRTAVKVYVRPAWMSGGEAKSIALGEAQHTAPPVRANAKENAVTEAEARELRAENQRLKNEVAELARRLGAMATHPTPKAALSLLDTRAARISDREPEPPPMAVSNDMDAIYAYMKRRAENDYALLRVLTERPELEVRVERKVLQVDGTSVKGRLAKLLADGFFDEGVSGKAVGSILRKTGKDPGGAQGNALNELVRDGFLTRDGDRSYRAVKDMRVNIVGDRA